MTSNTVLDKIAAAKRVRIDERLKKTSCNALREQAQACALNVPSFYKAVSASGKLNIIAEIKKASPSKGIIQPDFHPVEQAQAYEQAGASAISVLTEEDFFLGSDEYLKSIQKAVRLPVLRKDFIIDEMQIYEARCMGASAVLLIAAMLDRETLKYFYQITKAVGLDALVEVHNETELESALETGAEIIGINNRDLKTFQVNLGVTKRLAKLLPESAVKVAESGIHTAQDIALVKEAGVHAVLIGESLMRSQGSVDKKLQELMGK